MKVKVRGLVFVGFAAAVFAQSAFATITPNTAEKKIVTSKYYVDSTFQEEEDKVKLTGTQTIDDITSEQWASNDLYPSMNVLKGVKDTLDAVDVVDDGAGYVDVSVPETGDNAGKYVVGLDKIPVTSNAGITGTFGDGDGNKLVTAMGVKSLIDTAAISSSSDATHLPTSQAVYNYAEAKANKLAETTLGTTTITQTTAEATDGNTKFPTVRNVYDFVKAEGGNYQRKLTSSEDALYIGKWDSTIGTSGDSTWKALEAVSSNDQASTDYVTIKADGNGVYQVNIPASQIATTAALTGATATNDAGLVTAGSIRETILQAGNTAGGTIDATTGAVDTTVPTTKNVYEFVTNYAQDTYQPRVENNDAGKLMLGYSTQSGAAGSETYTPGWKELSVADVSNGSSLSSTGYVTKSVSGDVYTVNLDNALVTTTGAAINSYNASTNTGDGNDLVTVSAVKQYAGGIIDVANPCSASTTDGHYCALVAKYSATAPNNVEYEWTIMAPQQ